MSNQQDTRGLGAWVLFFAVSLPLIAIAWLVVLVLGGGASGVPSYLYEQEFTIQNHTDQTVWLSIDGPAKPIGVYDSSREFRAKSWIGPDRRRWLAIGAGVALEHSGLVSTLHADRVDDDVRYVLKLGGREIAVSDSIMNANKIDGATDTERLPLGNGRWFVSVTVDDADELVISAEHLGFTEWGSP
ncbi:MAG: hypothetical protein RIB60_00840 [Phycisphaerales bacterium]